MESEQSQNFNERLSQWVANQGFWFQIRYSMSGGAKGAAVFHLLRMGFRLLIFLLVAAVAGWVYLEKVTGTKKFADGLQDRIKAGLSASEIEVKDFNRSQGHLGINRFACQGGNDTFFSTLEARNVRCKMGLFDGVTGKWDTGTVSISSLDMEFRAGADDAESAQKMANALFDQSRKVTLNTVEVTDATVRWGFSDRTRGVIENSMLNVQRQPDGMKLSFKGGTFSQNWLNKLDIVEIVIVCDRETMVFEKAELRRGVGTVDFSGTRIIGGERPMVEGMAKIRKLAFDHTLPPALRTFVEGSISGAFRIFGSTNSPEGVGFEGKVTLDGQDTISLRERIHLLKALSTVDYVRNYHRVDFREGSFQMKTIGGGMELTDLSLKADDLFSLDGNLKVRLPTPEEASAAVEKGAVSGGSPLFDTADSTALDGLDTKTDDVDLTLRRAAKEAKNSKDGVQSDTPTSLSGRLTLNLQERQLQAQAAERMSRTLRYEGSFRISLPADAFERAPRLLQQFPVDPKTGRIPMEVPIEGNIYEVTLKQAEEIYQQGRR